MTEPRAEYDAAAPRKHYLKCACGHRLAWINGAGDVISTVAADWKVTQGKPVVRCHRCGNWVKVDTS